MKLGHGCSQFYKNITVFIMRFIVLKTLLVIFLTAVNVNLTLCYPDYLSAESSLGTGRTDSHRQASWAWYTYDVVPTKHFNKSSQVEYVNFELTAKNITKTPWIQYNLQESKDHTTNSSETIVTNASAYNLNNQPFTFSIENNDRDIQTANRDETIGTGNSPYNLNNKPYVFGVGNDNKDSKPAIDQYTGGDSSSAKEPKRKSEIKCEEYGRAVGRKVWALLLVGTDPEGVPVSSENTRCDGLHTPLIVGGTRAQLGEFPHMAALGWPRGGTVQYLCGGSLISERWILTAAHCTHGQSGSPSVVRLGTHILSNNTLGQVLEIKSIQRYPTYKPPAMYADIALIELKTSVTFKDNIRPTCLYHQFDAAPSQAWVTGWGVTQVGEDTSDTLLKARLDVIDTVECARLYSRSAAVPRGVVPSMMCAADLSGGWQSDTCQGDSGGPLQVIHPTISCLYQIVGITSFGKLCALRDSPGVYTRVSQYLDWIEGIVWPEPV